MTQDERLQQTSSAGRGLELGLVAFIVLVASAIGLGAAGLL